MNIKVKKAIACALAITTFSVLGFSSAEAKTSKQDIAKAQKMYAQGLNNFKNNNIKLAAEEFMEAAKTHEDNPLYNMFAGDCLRLLKQYPSSIRYYTVALDNIKHAQKNTRDKIKIKSYVGLAQSYLGTKDNVNALKYADKAIEDFKKDYRGHYIKGEIYYADQSTHDKAIEEYKKSLEVDKTQYSSYVKLLKLYYEQDNIDKVIETYKTAVDYRPTDTTMKMALAQVYISHVDESTNKHYYEEAIATLKDLINVEPKNAFAHYYLSTMYVLTDNLPKAQEELGKTNALNPNLGNKLNREIVAYQKKHANDKKVETQVTVDSNTNQVSIKVNGKEKEEIFKGQGEEITIDEDKKDISDKENISDKKDVSEDKKKEKELIKKQIDKLTKAIKD